MKTFLKIVLILLIVGAIGVLLIGPSLNALVKTGVETMGSQVLGTSVTLKEVDISLIPEGDFLQGNFIELVVKNPPGFQTDEAFWLPSIQIRLDRQSVLTDTVIIEEIVIDQPEVTFEGGLGTSNLDTINERLNEYSRGNSSQSGEKATSESDQGKKETQIEQEKAHEKKLQINHVIVKDGTINLSMVSMKGLVFAVPLPDLHLRDIGTDSGGVTIEEASAEVFDGVYASITETVSGSGKLVDEGTDQIERTVEALGEAGEQAGRAILKGLFGR